MMEPVSVATDWLGALAAALTTGSFLPQALLTLKTKDVSGISAGMYALFTAGVALWLVYGVMLGQWPIIVANAVTLVLAGLILSTKLSVDRGRSRTTNADQP
jgi:MtN3 and saliva related transmembrane protein